MLGVRKEKVARLVKGGLLTSRPSRVDARKHLIPREQVEQLLAEEGRGSAPQSRPRPRIAGMVNDPTLQSRDLEDYMAAHWRPR